MDIHIGLTELQRDEITNGLYKLLADSYALYIKTHSFHWNVTGLHFNTLHKLFDEQYTELAKAIDEIAERIRALGAFVPASFSQFNKLTTITEEPGVPLTTNMIQQLLDGQEEVVRTARHLMPILEAAHDAPSVDLVTRRMLEHEKNGWMLRSILEEN